MTNTASLHETASRLVVPADLPGDDRVDLDRYMDILGDAAPVPLDFQG